MSRLCLTRLLRGLLLLPALLVPLVAGAQIVPLPEAGSPPDAPAITLDEAIQIALVRNYALRESRLDVEVARSQVRQAWASVLPQVDASASYTRNIKTANPFAGSEAGGFFQTLGFLDWLAYNEGARTDDDPATLPIPLDTFFERRQDGLDRAGIRPASGDNLFAVPNQFVSSVNVEQTLFSGAAFAAIRGAERLREVSRRGADRQEQLVVDGVRQAFYGALLAAEQAHVAAQSVERTRATTVEVSRRVAQGTVPKAQRLGAEVQLANLESQQVVADNAAALALDRLKLLLGLPVEQPLRLRGSLQPDDPAAFLQVDLEDAVARALRSRPDLRQAELAVELRGIDRDLTRAGYLPTVSAFVGFSYLGTVPDNRTRILTDPADPFAFSTQQRGFFDGGYWNGAVNAGFRLRWTLFDGLRTAAQVQQKQIEIERARIGYDLLAAQVRLDVERALRDLHAARRRIAAQQQNVDRAELNYRYALARLDEGVAGGLEEREASEQLDQSRLFYLQAVYDFLTARSALETALGLPPVRPTEAVQLTRNGTP